MTRIILTLFLCLIGSPALSQTLIIAHRGASGERPEHTRAAYDRAIDQGADFIEPDLVMSRDGVLVVRHENEISGTTDVAARPEFADRRTTRVIDGQSVTGWFTEDFTLAELKTLRARERLPAMRPANTPFDGQEPILTFQEVIDIAREGSARTGRPIGVAPELKHPSYFEARGLAMVDAFVAMLEANGLTHAEAPILIQCFEVEPLRRLADRIDSPLLQLIAASGGPFDRPGLTYAAMVTPAGLADISHYAAAVGVETRLVLSPDAPGATALVADAHAHGLKVVVWTLRAENAFLPAAYRRGSRDAEHGDLAGYFAAFEAAGVDAVFTDFPAIAVAARNTR